MPISGGPVRVAAVLRGDVVGPDGAVLASGEIPVTVVIPTSFRLVADAEALARNEQRVMAEWDHSRPVTIQVEAGEYEGAG